MRKNKKLLAILIALLFVMSFSLPVLAGNHPGQGVGKGLEKKAERTKVEQEIKNYKIMEQGKIKVRNKHINSDLPPVIKDGRTLIPVRAITQGLGAEVDWDEKNRIVTVTKGDIEIKFDLEYGEVYINGEEADIDVPPGLINNRVFVPLRFISEVFGEKVKHNPDTDEIEIGDEVGDIKGYVTERESGEAIEGVMVIVLKDEERIKRARTDSNGLYSLVDVPVGTYTLEFSHDDYNSVSKYEVRVKEDSITNNINVIMMKKETEVGDVLGKVTIEGTGIRDVSVYVYDGEDWIKRATTDRRGEYTISDLPVGNNRLEFRHEDYETVRKRVLVEEGKVSTADATMIQKSVEEGSISGTVTTGDGNPIRSVDVYVYDGDDLVEQTRTRSNGEFTIGNIPYGVYSLEFSHNDYITVTMDDFDVESPETILIIPMDAIQ